jgi:hypothetical protein
MPDPELYRHFSPPNIHWTLNICVQVHWKDGSYQLSEFFHRLLSRSSISNLAEVVDREIECYISSLWIAQSSS